MAAFVTRLQPMMVAHPSRSSATGAIDNSPGGSYRHWPHTHTGRTSFDHLVGTRREHRWHINAERFRSFEVDDEFEFDCLHRGQVGGFDPVENPANVHTGLTKCVREARTVARQTAFRREVAPFVDCGHGMMRCQRHKLITAAAEEWIGGD